MGKPIAAHQFQRVDGMARSEICRWNCHQERFDGLPVCLDHALMIYRFMHETFVEPQFLDEREPEPEIQPYVYYLMVGPNTVKIGTTRHLKERIRQLRTDLQYVVAIEHGGFDVEHQRHREYAAERVGNREDFIISDRLQAHIETLQPNRDEMVALATRTRSERVTRKNGEFMAG